MTAPAKAAPVVAAATAGETFGPWNPGIVSQLPRELLPLSTLFRPENVLTSVAQASELRDLTGIDIFDLVAIRPERLALHELLIRVTADLSVPSGSRVEDLGINFRRMVNTLLANHIASRMTEVDAACAALRRRLAALIDAELATRIFQPTASIAAAASPRRAGFFGRFRRAEAAVTPDSIESASVIRAQEAMLAWRHEAHAVAASDPIRSRSTPRACQGRRGAHRSSRRGMGNAGAHRIPGDGSGLQ